MIETNVALIAVPSIVLVQPNATVKIISAPALLNDGYTPNVGIALDKATGKVGGVVVAQGVYGYVKQTPAYNINFFLDFASVVTQITSIDVYYCAASNYSDDSGVNYATRCTKTLYIKQGGAYSQVAQNIGMPSAGPSTIQLWTTTFGTPQANIQGIKLNAYNAYESRSSWYLGFYVSEIRINGTALMDSNMRIRDGAGHTIKVGRYPTGTLDKVRYRCNGVTYSLPLVEMANPLASPVRTYVDGSVQALVDIS